MGRERQATSSTPATTPMAESMWSTPQVDSSLKVTLSEPQVCLNLLSFLFAMGKTSYTGTTNLSHPEKSQKWMVVKSVLPCLALHYT